MATDINSRPISGRQKGVFGGIFEGNLWRQLCGINAVCVEQVGNPTSRPVKWRAAWQQVVVVKKGQSSDFPPESKAG